jgi:hypothetical protein
VCSLLMGNQDNQQVFVRKVESWVPLLAFKVHVSGRAKNNQFSRLPKNYESFNLDFII